MNFLFSADSSIAGEQNCNKWQNDGHNCIKWRAVQRAHRIGEIDCKWTNSRLIQFTRNPIEFYLFSKNRFIDFLRSFILIFYCSVHRSSQMESLSVFSTLKTMHIKFVFTTNERKMFEFFIWFCSAVNWIYWVVRGVVDVRLWVKGYTSKWNSVKRTKMLHKKQYICKLCIWIWLSS